MKNDLILKVAGFLEQNGETAANDNNLDSKSEASVTVFINF